MIYKHSCNKSNIWETLSWPLPIESLWMQNYSDVLWTKTDFGEIVWTKFIRMGLRGGEVPSFSSRESGYGKNACHF